MNPNTSQSSQPASTDDHIAQLYQSIGELVMAIQWVEGQYRELGWFIDDPERTVWPPRKLRQQSFAQLIDIVTEMFLDLIQTSSFPNGNEFAQIAVAARSKLHALRNYRNQVLHSAFVELKAGGEVVGYLYADVKRGVDPDTGELIGTLEHISADAVRATLGTYGEACFQLGLMYTQASHWYGLEDGARWRSRSDANEGAAE